MGPRELRLGRRLKTVSLKPVQPRIHALSDMQALSSQATVKLCYFSPERPNIQGICNLCNTLDWQLASFVLFVLKQNVNYSKTCRFAESTYY